MLGIVLLVIGLTGLVLTVLSLIGLDLGGVDIHLGDSGAGLLSVLMPFLTGFGLITGGLLTFAPDSVSGLGAVLIGGGVGVVLALVSLVLVKWLWGAGEEVPDLELIGLPVRVVDPVSAERYGTGDVNTPLGSQRITLTAKGTYRHNDQVRIIAKLDDKSIYLVEQLPFSDLDR